MTLQDGFWVVHKPLVPTVKFDLAQSPVDHFQYPSVSILIYFAPAYYIRLLFDCSFHLYHYIPYICYFVVACLFLLYGVIRCCYQKRVLFSHMAFLSQPCPSILMRDFGWLSLECSCSCFSLHFNFLITFVPLMFVLFILFLVAVIKFLIPALSTDFSLEFEWHQVS